MRRRRRLFSLFFAASLTALAVAACSGESEGQRCDLTDDPGGPDDSPGSSDCAGNLKCYSAATLGGQAATWANGNSNFGICCPVDRATSTTSICAFQPSPPGGDASPPPDAASDAASDAPVTEDGSVDGGTEGGGDAGEDSTAPDGSGTSDTGTG